jgi:hypothetical protein
MNARSRFSVQWALWLADELVFQSDQGPDESGLPDCSMLQATVKALVWMLRSLIVDCLGYDVLAIGFK